MYIQVFPAQLVVGASYAVVLHGTVPKQMIKHRFSEKLRLSGLLPYKKKKKKKKDKILKN